MKETKNKNSNLTEVLFRSKSRGHRVLVLAFATIMMSTFVACSSENGSTEGQITNTTSMTEESLASAEEMQQLETEAEAEVEAEPADKVVDGTAEEVVEETTPEKPQVEMVDFETWAKQEEHDEVCLVVWNEELGVQEMIPTVTVSEKIYEIQEGDRLAIPYRESITFLGIRKQSTWIWPADKGYYELSLPKGEISIVDIAYHNEAGETIVLSYSLK